MSLLLEWQGQVPFPMHVCGYLTLLFGFSIQILFFFSFNQLIFFLLVHFFVQTRNVIEVALSATCTLRQQDKPDARAIRARRHPLESGPRLWTQWPKRASICNCQLTFQHGPWHDCNRHQLDHHQCYSAVLGKDLQRHRCARGS